MSLNRIAAWLGAMPKEQEQRDPIQTARQLGIPVANQLPADPDLVFLQHEVPLGGTRPHA